MPLADSSLANQLHLALGSPPDKDGVVKVPKELQAYARGIIKTLKAGTFSHVVVSGVTAPGAPLAGGFAVGGIMVLVPAIMLGETALSFPPGAQPKIQAENAAVIGYLMTGLINFAPGTITGNCTNTPVSPGPLLLGQGSGGTVLGLNGPTCFAAVFAALGTPGPFQIPFYSALCAYITASLQATYPLGTVNGVCPIGGGPLAGVGVGGVIS